jgi:hypothetical protein
MHGQQNIKFQPNKCSKALEAISANNLKVDRVSYWSYTDTAEDLLPTEHCLCGTKSARS